MHRGRILYFLFLLITCLTVVSVRSNAQAVADTSLNTVFPDTTKRAEPGITQAGTDSNQTAAAANVTTPAADSTLDIDAKKEPFQPKPKRSGMYSAICPGLGQLYNRQYWKIPVIYVGIGVAAYIIANNLNNYQTYRLAYIDALSNHADQFTGIYNTSQLQQLESQYEQYLDLAVLFTGIGYALQVLDAVTYAHLKNFDISRDLSMKMQPVAFPRGAGLGLVLNWK
jgi:hypothetical protein